MESDTGLGFRVQVSVFRVSGTGFRVQRIPCLLVHSSGAGSGFRIKPEPGFRLKVGELRLNRDGEGLAARGVGAVVHQPPPFLSHTP